AYAEPPDPQTAEVVIVTAISGDTFTVQRAQEQPTPRAILAGDQIRASATAGAMNAMVFWHDLEVSDPAYYCVGPGDGSTPPVTGVWLPPTDPASSYAWAQIGVGTLMISFYLAGTTLGDNAPNASVFALRLPATEAGQAWGRNRAIGIGTTWVFQGQGWRPSFSYVGYEDAYVRFGTDITLTPGDYSMAATIIIPG